MFYWLSWATQPASCHGLLCRAQTAAAVQTRPTDNTEKLLLFHRNLRAFHHPPSRRDIVNPLQKMGDIMRLQWPTSRLEKPAASD